jgi:hypothetical protein
MDKSHKLKRSVEEDPEWYMGGVPVSPHHKNKRRMRVTKIAPDTNVIRAQVKVNAHRNYVRKALREMGYNVI